MTKTSTEAIREYRARIALQATLPASDAWTLGAEIKRAKLAAYVELESERAVHGRKLARVA
jgi:hypothetical protein